MDKFIIEGNLTDPGWLDTHTVSIDWGDNITENIPIKQENNPTSKIIAIHKYKKLKNYTATLTVTDDNNGTTTSQITIKSPRQIKQSTLSKLQTIQTNNKNARKDIDKAIASLKETLKNKYWKDDFRLNLLYSINFFTEEQKATQTLTKILSDKKKYSNFQDTQKIQETVNELSQSDTYLVKAMIYDAGSRTSTTLKLIKNWIDKILKV
jgi:PKD repeat protein